MIFLTVVGDRTQKKSARLLIESIREFSGSLGHCPVWIFESHPLKVPCLDLADKETQVFPLIIPKSVSGYDFAGKVFACALAEKMTKEKKQTLVWIDPCCLVLQPPLLFDLKGQSAAVRPVHIQNIGINVNDPIDPYWQKIYRIVGLAEPSLVVESFVDCQRLRAYFNSHAFAIDPSRGFMQKWFSLFEKLVLDKEFQNGACRDERHKLFLFQAVLSTILAAALHEHQIQILPPTYNYPYHLHSSVPADKRVQILNDLVLVTYEEQALDPAKMKDITIQEPLSSWLVDHLPN